MSGDGGFSTSPVLNPDAHVVYRLRSWTGLLLYVGCTNDVDRRLAEHRRLSPWFPLAHTVAEVRFAGPSSGFLAERTAIRDEHPLFNKVEYLTKTPHEVETLVPAAESDDEIGWALDFMLGGIFGSPEADS